MGRRTCKPPGGHRARPGRPASTGDPRDSCSRSVGSGHHHRRRGRKKSRPGGCTTRGYSGRALDAEVLSADGAHRYVGRRVLGAALPRRAVRLEPQASPIARPGRRRPRPARAPSRDAVVGGETRAQRAVGGDAQAIACVAVRVRGPRDEADAQARVGRATDVLRGAAVGVALARVVREQVREALRASRRAPTSFSAGSFAPSPTRITSMKRGTMPRAQAHVDDEPQARRRCRREGRRCSS